MKKILFTSLVAMMFLTCQNINSQTIEKVVNNKTFLINSVNGTIENKINSSLPKPIGQCDQYSITKWLPLEEIVKQVLPTGKINKLSQEKKRFIILCDSDKSGKILRIRFLLRDIFTDTLSSDSKITLNEVEAIEKALFKCKITLDSNCTDVNWYNFTQSVSFDKISK